MLAFLPAHFVLRRPLKLVLLSVAARHASRQLQLEDLQRSLPGMASAVPDRRTVRGWLHPLSPSFLGRGLKLWWPDTRYGFEGVGCCQYPARQVKPSRPDIYPVPEPPFATLTDLSCYSLVFCCNSYRLAVRFLLRFRPAFRAHSPFREVNVKGSESLLAEKEFFSTIPLCVFL